MTTNEPEFIEAEKAVKDRFAKLMNIKGKRSVDSLHKELGLVMWDFVGMGRNAAGLKIAIEKIAVIKKEFWSNVRIPGDQSGMNVELEKASRLADFIEIGELMARDGLNREESCGGHFREEYQTPEGEALRDDDHFAYVGCWEFKGDNVVPELHKEELVYDSVKMVQRNYK
jgi:succinate dehydrogenase / fumarate reductase flavoprotein subunit